MSQSVWLLQLCRYCLWVNDINGFYPASTRMTLAYTTVRLSSYHICGAATTPGLWPGNNVTYRSNGLLVSSVVPVQQQRGECDCCLFVISTALHIGAGNDIEVSFDQTKMWSHLVQCFSVHLFHRQKKSQAKYACKYSHSCVLPLWVYAYSCFVYTTVLSILLSFRLFNVFTSIRSSKSYPTQ